MATEIFLEKMTWPEVEERLKESNIAMVVVASTEAHGRHLPLETDFVEVWEITKRAAMKVADEVKPVIAPPIPYGVSPHLMPFKGTITLREQTLRELVRDVCESLIHHGFKKIVLMDGHGGNPPALLTVMNEVSEKTGAFIAKVDWWGAFGGDVIEKTTETHHLYHACEGETSVAWACGARVLMNEAERSMPASPSKYIKFNAYAPSPIVRAAHGSILALEKLTRTSALGDPTLASKEKGERIVKAIVDRLADFLRELKAIKL